MSNNPKTFYEFGPFLVDSAGQQLWRGGKEIPLTPKAFGVLLVLVEHAGQTILKDELMQAVWPDAFVEENNLTDNISVLRRALGDDPKSPRYIKTLPRRGYRFVANVKEVRDEEVDLIVAEHTQARVIIEEETHASDKSVMMNVADESLQRSPTVRALAVTPIAPLARLEKHRRVVALVIVASVVGSGAALLALYLAFKSGKPAKAERAMTITRVTNSGRSATASISPDGKLIAYTQNYSPGNYTAGTGSLYVQQTGSNHEVQLLEPGERFFGNTAFSSDSALIYYVVYDKRDPKGALYRIPALGGPPTRLLGDIISMFSLSPDGDRVTFYRYDSSRKQLSLMITQLDGSGEQRLLTRPYNDVAFTGMPAWSPDGKTIAFVPDPEVTKGGNNGELATIDSIDISSGATKPLTGERWAGIGNIVWMSDGRGLVFIASHARTGNQLYCLSYPEGEVRRITNDLHSYGNYGLGITADGSAVVAETWESTAQLWMVRADGDTSHAIKLTGGDYDGKGGISTLPDGRIVYVAREGWEYDLWTVKKDGTEPKALTADSFLESEIAAAPDGRYLVFTSDRAGGSHIFRTEGDGSHAQQLTFGDGWDDAPDCSSDGQWIVYASTVNQKTTVWKVSIEGGTPVQLTKYECVAPSFSPDGQFISCVIPAENVTQKGSIAVIPAEGGPPLQSFNVMPFFWSYLSARWTPDGQALTFRDSLGNYGNLWKQPLTGESPSQLTNFKSETIFNYAFSRDGQHLILARGQTVINVVLIKDFR